MLTFVAGHRARKFALAGAVVAALAGFFYVLGPRGAPPPPGGNVPGDMRVDAGDTAASFDRRVALMKSVWPRHFLEDAAVVLTDSVVRPTVYGEPDPPEGFAGPDPEGRLGLGMYVPKDYAKFFRGDDISVYQWVFHEAFHLHNRRFHDYDTFIATAFPTGNEPLVRWIARDPYHRTFAREEAFINLATFADVPETDSQSGALRAFYDHIGPHPFNEEVFRSILQAVDHRRPN